MYGNWLTAQEGEQGDFVTTNLQVYHSLDPILALRPLLSLLQANWLKTQGVKRGDVVTVYLPMLCELPIVMLACARIGAMHSVVFAGFSADSLAQRVIDSRCAGWSRQLAGCRGARWAGRGGTQRGGGRGGVREVRSRGRYWVAAVGSCICIYVVKAPPVFIARLFVHLRASAAPNPCPPAHMYACDAHRSRVIITATGTKRGTKPVDLKPIVDQAIAMCSKDGHKVGALCVLALRS